MIEFGAWWTIAAAVVVAIGWSRVRLRDHTAAQVAVGAMVGMIGALGYLVAR